ncbi:hypothetical protein K435DRAFT_807298 [Dendrothele bispora CBS 962.96]|uniref:Uncharacterized protein n=1 Tax=Dendrothele bispora (strain CBS 962.96) TaxID=1314807 RepID=A0A4V4HCK2_DENBC|nr:hypothetical protein K435DRAFT_807298 [Dendrothele bispora CBS 962.96]
MNGPAQFRIQMENGSKDFSIYSDPNVHQFNLVTAQIDRSCRLGPLEIRKDRITESFSDTGHSVLLNVHMLSGLGRERHKTQDYSNTVSSSVQMLCGLDAGQLESINHAWERSLIFLELDYIATDTHVKNLDLPQWQPLYSYEIDLPVNWTIKSVYPPDLFYGSWGRQILVSIPDNGDTFRVISISAQQLFLVLGIRDSAPWADLVYSTSKTAEDIWESFRDGGPKSSPHLNRQASGSALGLVNFEIKSLLPIITNLKSVL